MWNPILQREMGYREFADPETGELSLQRLSEEELLAGMSEQDRMSYDIAQEASKRELSALRGELPVDPALEREIGEGKQELSERMFRQLGGGWETSTPGIYNIEQHKQRASELRDAMRRGEMTTSEALAQSRMGGLEESRQRLMEQSTQRTAAPIALSGAYESPKSWYTRGREEQFKGKLAKLEAKKAMMSGISGGVSGGCCWTFIEAEGGIPEEVRQYRDAHHPKSGNVASGYTWMSNWLVPLMKKYPLVKKVVRKIMTQPMTKYAQWCYGKNKYGWIFYLPSLFWGCVWEGIGWLQDNAISQRSQPA